MAKVSISRSSLLTQFHIHNFRVQNTSKFPAVVQDTWVSFWPSVVRYVKRLRKDLAEDL